MTRLEARKSDSALLLTVHHEAGALAIRVLAIVPDAAYLQCLARNTQCHLGYSTKHRLFS